MAHQWSTPGLLEAPSLVINDPHRHWNAKQRASRSYPVFDTGYRYDELAETLAGLVEPEKVPPLTRTQHVA